MAAVLAVGDGAIITGRTAASLYRATRWPETPIEVVAARRYATRLPCVQVWRSSTLCGMDHARGRGLPVASMPRMLTEMMHTHTEWQLAYVQQPVRWDE